MNGVLGAVIDVVVVFAWIFFFWGIGKDWKVCKPEYAKDRNFQVKTFWVLSFGSILWFAVGVANVFDGMPFLFEGFLTLLFGYRAYVLNKAIRTLPAPR